eukprot:TRINITY_DN1267_c0_g1_i4.p1 TRINITY_DN1267_c0_g1~~TRINITY_DN1267_c0_g1_i4.p1  ORF type:complete len:298 (-),score=106.64 TRINITY_DN1267_c0_g1_i4:348-1241(-)
MGIISSQRPDNLKNKEEELLRTRRMNTREKYRRNPEASDQTPLPENEIRVRTQGRPAGLIFRALDLFRREQNPFKVITLRSSGGAIPKACVIADVLRRRIRGLQQINTISTTTVSDTYSPLEEGLDVVQISRSLAVLEIRLSLLDNEDKNHIGYVAPLPESEIQENQPLPRSGDRPGGFRGGRGGRPFRDGDRGGPRGRGGRPYRGDRSYDGENRGGDRYNDRGYQGESRGGDRGYQGENRGPRGGEGRGPRGDRPYGDRPYGGDRSYGGDRPPRREGGAPRGGRGQRRDGGNNQQK